MTRGTFQKVGQSDQPQYGPRAILVCGFAPDEQGLFMKLLETIGLAKISVTFSSLTDSGERLADLLARPDQTGRGTEAETARAVILSGISEKELHRLLPGYRRANLPRPLWATLTPTSENWTLAALLRELEQERKAMEQQKK